MNYVQAREYVSSLSSRGIVPGLKTISSLCEALGNPQDKIKTIHIAGTNGKGSVGAFISSILRCNGTRTGRYASPAVNEYREIISINGEYIEENAYAQCVSEICDVCKKHSIFPTAFEFETALAFLYFYKKQCGYAVIECGMGGLLDATNIIKCPQAAVITSISTDHTAFLGNTLTEIAYNKSGIIKSGTIVFSSNQTDEALTVIKQTADKCSVPVHICSVPENIRRSLDGTIFDCDNMQDIKIQLLGEFQPYNASLAISCCKALGIGEDKIKHGLLLAKWAYRFEITQKNPYWIYDGAHNPSAAEMLKKSIDTYFNGKKNIFIIGVFRDKDYKKILKITAHCAEKIFTVTPPGERGLESSILADYAKIYCPHVIDAHNYKNAVMLCGKEKCDAVIVFGSLSFLKYIKKEKSDEQMS